MYAFQIDLNLDKFVVIPFFSQEIQEVAKGDIALTVTIQEGQTE